MPLCMPKCNIKGCNCCRSSKTEVIDFDATKVKVSEISNLQHPKSADALKIINDLKRFYFY